MEFNRILMKHCFLQPFEDIIFKIFSTEPNHGDLGLTFVNAIVQIPIRISKMWKHNNLGGLCRMWPLLRKKRITKLLIFFYKCGK